VSVKLVALVADWTEGDRAVKEHSQRHPGNRANPGS